MHNENGATAIWGPRALFGFLSTENLGVLGLWCSFSGHYKKVSPDY